MTKPKDLTDISAERGMIGAIMLDPTVLDLPEVAGIGRAAFHGQFYGETFDLAREHYRAGRVPDMTLLSSDLEAAGASDAFGKLAGIIADDRPEIWNAGEYARRIVDLADRRAALVAVEQAARDIYNRNGDWREHVAGAGVTLAMVDERVRPQPLDVQPIADLSTCPALSAAAQLDPALCEGASPWLDDYIEFSRQWAPRAYDGFHEATGLSVLSTVAARRVKLDFGGERYTSLPIANVARSSVFTKSTAHHIGGALLEAAGLSFLAAPDDATPQALLARMSLPAKVKGWDVLTPEQREREALRLAFAGQKGWDFDEFGAKVSSMMRDSGVMADFRGLLRRFDDCPSSYSYATIGRGENVIDRPYLAILASMTPADMAPYAKRGGALWRDGFWARFAFVAPSPEAQPSYGRFPSGKRILPYDLVSKLRRWHDALGVPDVDVVQRRDAEGKPTDEFDVTVTAPPPQSCQLGAGVYERFYAYHDALTALAAASDNADLDGNYSRFAEKALRVAMLLASLENDGRIELRHWARAQAIAERWRESLHNLYRTMNAGQDEASRIEDQVAEIVQRLGTQGATPTDVRRYVRSLSTTEAATILDRLTKAGVLRSEKTRKGTLRYEYCES